MAHIHRAGYIKKKVRTKVETIVYHYICKKCIPKQQQKIIFNFF